MDGQGHIERFQYKQLTPVKSAVNFGSYYSLCLCGRRGANIGRRGRSARDGRERSITRTPAHECIGIDQWKRALEWYTIELAYNNSRFK